MGLEKRDQFLLIVVQFGLSVALQAANIKDLEKCCKEKKTQSKGRGRGLGPLEKNDSDFSLRILKQSKFSEKKSKF